MCSHGTWALLKWDLSYRGRSIDQKYIFRSVFGLPQCVWGAGLGVALCSKIFKICTTKILVGWSTLLWKGGLGLVYMLLFRRLPVGAPCERERKEWGLCSLKYTHSKRESQSSKKKVLYLSCCDWMWSRGLLQTTDEKGPPPNWPLLRGGVQKVAWTSGTANNTPRRTHRAMQRLSLCSALYLRLGPQSPKMLLPRMLATEK